VPDSLTVQRAGHRVGHSAVANQAAARITT